LKEGQTEGRESRCVVVRMHNLCWCHLARQQQKDAARDIGRGVKSHRQRNTEWGDGGYKPVAQRQYNPTFGPEDPDFPGHIQQNTTETWGSTLTYISGQG
jgi:hypothetical protein